MMTRKTPMLPKPEAQMKQSMLPAAAIAFVVVAILAVMTAALRTPERMRIDPPAPVATHAAPTAAPAATPQPKPTATMAPTPAPVEVIDLAPPPEPPPPVVEEVQAVEVQLTPLVFVQGVCAEWHPPQVLPEECDHE